MVQEPSNQPQKDIFVAQPSSMTPVIDKNKIIGKKSYRNILFVFIAIIIFILISVLVVGFVVPRVTGPKEITLTWWSLEEDAEAAVPLIDEYQKQNPNVKIKFVRQSTEDYEERLINSLAKPQAPDIFEFHNSWMPVLKNNLSLTTTDFSTLFYPVVTADLKTPKGFAGIPLEYDGIALLVNEDLLRSYGKSAPKTWDELRKIAQDMTIRDQNGSIKQAGVALGVSANIDYWQDALALLMLQNGANLQKPMDLAGESALTFFTNFAKVDRVWDETLPNSTLDFASGKLAMYFGTYKQVFEIQKQNPNLHFGVVPVPQLPKSDTANSSISYANYWVNGVSSKSPHTAAAWDFLKFMASKETLTKLYANEKKIRGYGNLYPRADMQSELLTDIVAAPFIYQASFAKSWYLNDKTNDSTNGINSQIAKVYGEAISTSDFKNTNASLEQILSSY